MDKKDLLNLEFNRGDLPNIRTLGDYLKKLFRTLWKEGECFNSKRPFGNSDWQYEVYYVLIKNNIIDGTIDKYDCVDIVDFYQADKVISELINNLFEETSTVTEEEHELLINHFEEATEELRKQIKQESDARKRFVEEVKKLKQQLAEKEKDIAELKTNNTNIFEYSQKIEEELAENEAYIQGNIPKLIEANKIMSKRLAEKGNKEVELREEIARLNSVINENKKEISGIKNSCDYYMNRSNDLVLQLTEKEKEIKTMRESSDKNIDYLTEFASLIEDQKDCNRMLKALERVRTSKKYIVDKEHRDKISFAVEQLEKVKEYYTIPIYDRENSHTEVRVLLQRIDNQIRQLREKK